MNSISKQLVLVAVIFVMLFACSAIDAAESLTKAQEASALKFARQHHSELAELLKKLDQEMASEYEKAVRQLHLVNQRLERVQERSPEDYKIQLAIWKVDSRIKLLAARMTMSSDNKLTDEMEKLLTQKIEFKEKQLLIDQERTQVRLDRIDGQLQKIRSNRKEYLAKELARYRRLQTPKTTPTSTKNNTNK